MNLMFKLMAVSKSGYHEWLYRGISSREQANNKLTKQIRSVHQESRKIYGGGVFTQNCALKGSLAVKIALFVSNVKRELWRRLGDDLKLQRILNTNFPLAETY